MKKTLPKPSARNRLSQLCKGIASDIHSLGLDKVDDRPTKSELEKIERRKLLVQVQKQLKGLS